MTSEQLIEKNNQLREQLSPANKAYYENLLLYLRTKSLSKNDQQVETLLLEILQDMLEAQAKGISSKDYFGKSPQAYADDMIKVLPNDFIEAFKLILITIGSFTFFGFFPSLLNPQRALDIGSIGLTGLYAIILVIGIFYIINRDIYRNKNILSRILKIILIIILAIPIFLIMIFVRTSFQLKLQGILGISVIILLMLSELIWYFRQKDRKLWFFLNFSFIGFGVLDILARLPKLGHYLINNSTGKIYLVVTIIALCYLPWLRSVLFKYKKNKKS
ncbi:DUF1129 family protein [Oenococcus oeni]|uniref:DUF1129 family protein n=1 Tax=Oenococcus oeni TaxID=1247 RepID=UPI0010B416EC|nr:DUF1129 family protein [Oenococcus oeni]SYW09019.1 conserved membrane hypothetical protein [Oenococcus oeni]SYW10625.1 conserved membrane hypothetical protein [Oenococcus oeni]